jgi:hypothetical protein
MTPSSRPSRATTSSAKTTKPKRAAVVDVAPEEQPAPTYSFQLAALPELQEQDELNEGAVFRVSLGSSPRISLAAGETFTTENAKLARRLRRDEHLFEVAS